MKTLLVLVLSFIISTKLFAQDNDSISPQINKLFFNVLHVNNISDFTLELQNRKAEFIDTPVARMFTKAFLATDFTQLSAFFSGIQRVLLVAQETKAENQKIFRISIELSFTNSISKEQAYIYHKKLKKIFTLHYKYERSNNYWAEKGSYLSYGSMQFRPLYPIELQYPRKTNEGHTIIYTYNFLN